VIAGRQSYRLHAHHAPNECLDAPNGAHGGNVQLQIWSCNVNWQQRFWLQDTDDGTTATFIEPAYSDPNMPWCVTVGPEPGNGDPAYLTLCTVPAGQPAAADHPVRLRPCLIW
jgi:hypothetical protein